MLMDASLRTGTVAVMHVLNKSKWAMGESSVVQSLRIRSSLPSGPTALPGLHLLICWHISSAVYMICWADSRMRIAFSKDLHMSEWSSVSYFK